MQLNLKVFIIFLVVFTASYSYAAIKNEQRIPVYDAAKSQILQNMAGNSSYPILENLHYQTILRLNNDINRNRYYSPALGRFTSKDPIGFNGGNNLYRYADNNPMRFIDPTGNTAEELLLIMRRALPAFMLADAVCVLGVAAYSSDAWNARSTHDKWAHSLVGCRIAKACGGRIVTGLAAAGWEVWANFLGHLYQLYDPNASPPPIDDEDIQATLEGAECPYSQDCTSFSNCLYPHP